MDKVRREAMEVGELLTNGATYSNEAAAASSLLLL